MRDQMEGGEGIGSYRLVGVRTGDHNNKGETKGASSGKSDVSCRGVQREQAGELGRAQCVLTMSVEWERAE